MGLNLKKIKVFKVIITTLLFIAFTVSVISCKEEIIEEVAEEEEEEEVVIDSSEAKETQETIPSETTETIPKETKEETSPAEEETPVDSALEAILKEKVSFISKALPEATLNTKTGELTAKVGNEWGIKEGESIGWYVAKAFKMETSDGVEEEQDAIGLIPTVIEAMQNKDFEEKGEKSLPIPINLKETKNVEIKELKVKSGWGFGASSFGLNVPVGTIIYSPLSLEWGFNENDLLTKNGTSDKSIHTAYESDSNNTAQIYMDFVEGNIIPSFEKTDVFPLEDNKEIPIFVYNVKLGDPLIEITGLSFLDETANNIEDCWYFYENPGQYQFDIFHFKNIVDKGVAETIEFLSLKKNQESENIKVFISPNEPAHEQNN